MSNTIQRAHDLEILIQERKMIIYTLESALLDNEPKFPKAYKLCMKDEIENHNCFIHDYEEELALIKIGHHIPESQKEEPFLMDQQQFQELTHDEKEEYRAQFKPKKEEPIPSEGRSAVNNELKRIWGLHDANKPMLESDLKYISDYYEQQHNFWQSRYQPEEPKEGEIDENGWAGKEEMQATIIHQSKSILKYAEEIAALKSQIASFKEKIPEGVWRNVEKIHELQAKTFSRDDMILFGNAVFEDSKYGLVWRGTVALLNDYIKQKP